ncbi:MAG: cytochrome c family protein [Paenirhodobacter sp.]|uniref:c-type cytochrome n=1 Tax=Paenirhodobacter sp. TaxID=1965326 RepID=UPI003D128C4D
MLNSTTFTKAVGGVLVAFLVFLIANWASNGLFALHSPAAPAEGETQVAMMTAAPGGDAPAADAAPAAEAAPVDVAAILAEGDAAAGEKVFGKCKACHKTDGTNAVGPHLNGVVNRPTGTVPDFSYSDAMKSHGGDWTPENLFAYLEDPKGVVPGNKMSFAGLKKPADRANVIAYLETLQ